MPKFSSTFLQFFLLLVGSSTGRIPSLILDTDMDFDVDDVGALCLAHSLQVYTYSLQLDHTKGILCKSRQWNLGIWGLPLVLDDLDTFKGHDFFNLDIGFVYRISERQNFWQLCTALATQLLLELSLSSTTSLAETISFLVLSKETLEKRWMTQLPSCTVASHLYWSQTNYSFFITFLSFSALVFWIHWWSCGQLPLSSETLWPGTGVKIMLNEEKKKWK